MRENHRIQTGTMPTEQRLRRIAELLCKAIMRMEATRITCGTPVEPDTGTLGRPAFVDVPKKAKDERVLKYLHFVGTASPATIRGTLGLSRTEMNRVLLRLVEEGRIVGSGKTRSVAYRLNQAEPPADRIILN
jgi:hypothetical protein